MNPQKVLLDLVQSATGAKAHFDTWWALATEGREYWERSDNDHSAFFRAAYDAAYVSFFVYLAHLYDKRRDASSLSTYIRLARGTTPVGQHREFEERYKKLAVRAEPLVEARHLTVAHINALLSEPEVFKPLNVTWEEIRSVIYESADLVTQLAGSHSGGTFGVPKNGQLSEATLALIRSLPRVGA